MLKQLHSLLVIYDLGKLCSHAARCYPILYAEMYMLLQKWITVAGTTENGCPPAHPLLLACLIRSRWLAYIIHSMQFNDLAVNGCKTV
jgi:hypothetical protein